MRPRFRSEQPGPSVGSKAAGPLFIGGVPRSGTHALAGLLARHSRYAMVPRELGFHTGMGAAGLPDLFDERISVQEFTEVMAGYWWKRIAPWDTTVTRGLYKTIPRERFEQCLERFERTTRRHRSTRRRDSSMACSTHSRRRRQRNLDRDGSVQHLRRAVAVPALPRDEVHSRHARWKRRGSVDRKHALGSGGALTGVWRWQRILRTGHQRLRVLPADRVLTIRLEDLALRTREATYSRILDFLELGDEPEMHTFFREGISPRSAHIARWRELSLGRRTAITSAYTSALARLALAGVGPLPTLRVPRVRLPPVETPRLTQAKPIDPWVDGAARDAWPLPSGATRVQGTSSSRTPAFRKRAEGKSP